MKRFYLYILVYLLFLCIPIKAEESTIYYRIYTNNENLKEIKNEVLYRLDDLCKGVESSSYKHIIKENLKDFEEIENVQAKFKNDILYIYAGGNKKYIRGEYKPNEVCIKEVKPKSLIKEWLN